MADAASPRVIVKEAAESVDRPLCGVQQQPSPSVDRASVLR
jgi:hypothetical protein